MFTLYCGERGGDMFLFPLLVEKFDEVAFLRVVWIGNLTGS